TRWPRDWSSDVCSSDLIAFIGTGKTFKATKEQVAAIGEKEWNVYDNGRQKWSYAGFEYRCDKWEKAYRALYTRPKYDGQQGLLRSEERRVGKGCRTRRS